jgi:hypothetical protein
VTVWPQDRFRGIVAGVSADRGRTWRRVVVPGLTRCTGGTFDYADDLSVAVGSDGVVHLSAHVFDADRQRSGLLASRSADGGRSWSPPRALVVDPAGGNGEYAGGSIVVDRVHSRLVYGVVALFAYPTGPAARSGARSRSPIAATAEGAGRRRGPSWTPATVG